MSTIITAKEFAMVGDKLNNTHTDPTPFPITEESADGKQVSINVVGDVNKVEQKKANYVIEFLMKKDMLQERLGAIPKTARIAGEYASLEVEYEDITIVPRNNLIIVEAIMNIQPLVKKLTEGGDVKKMTSMEFITVYNSLGQTINVAMYNIVATFLGIDDSIAAYMQPYSVLNALCLMIDMHPEVFNQADIFFGLATEKR